MSLDTIDRPSRSRRKEPPKPKPDLSWFSEHIERGQAGPYMEIVRVTPEIAARILEENKMNRNVSYKTVQRYAQDIALGHWRLNGETIIVSKDGYLNDGQQRLLAVIEAGVPIDTAMMFGVERDSRFTVDMGYARSTNQFLNMHGYRNVNHIGVAARLVYAFRNGIGALDAESYRYISKSSVQKEIAENEALYDATVARFLNADIGKLARCRGVIPAAYIIITEYSAQPVVEKMERIEKFFEGVIDGHDLGRMNPVLHLRQRLMALLPRTTRTPNADKLELILLHWNEWVQFGKMRRATLGLTGKYPSIA